MTRYHRIREVRLREGLNIKTVGILIGLSEKDARRIESPTNDISLAELQQWARAMRVPVTELVVDSPEVADECLRLRVGLTKAMKFIKTAIRDNDLPKNRASVHRTLTNLENHLVDIMPELENTAPWNSWGRCKGSSNMGRVVDFLVPSGLENETTVDG